VRKAWVVLAALVWLGSSACALDPFGRERSLEQSQRRYTELVRWGQLERASAFVDPEQRDEYLKNAAAFDTIRVTDFESGQLEFDPERSSATAIVVYHAYSKSTLLEKRIRENQQWYRDETLANQWHVRPELRQIIAGVNEP